MRARDVMATTVVCIGSDASIAEALDVMVSRSLSGLPVTDSLGRLVGMVTEADLLCRNEIGTEPRRPRWLRFFASQGRRAQDYTKSHGRRVDEVMTRDVVTVCEDAELRDIVELMLRRRIKRIPVVLAGRPIGLVTRADVLRALARMLGTRKTDQGLSDRAIAAAIQSSFDESGCIPANVIDVTVHDGIVDLFGAIFDERTREAVKVAVENVPGVRKVYDHLVWVEPSSGTALLSPGDRGIEVTPGYRAL